MAYQYYYCPFDSEHIDNMVDRPAYEDKERYIYWYDGQGNRVNKPTGMRKQG